MKKLVKIFTILLLSVSLMACGSEVKEDKKTKVVLVSKVKIEKVLNDKEEEPKEEKETGIKKEILTENKNDTTMQTPLVVNNGGNSLAHILT